MHRLRRMPGRLQVRRHQDEVGRGFAPPPGEDGRVRAAGRLALHGTRPSSSASSPRSPRTATAWPRPRSPSSPDIGILASLDPVAVDQATADLLVAAGAGKDPLRAGYDIDWSAQLAHGEKIGLGRRDYRLVEIA
ncbi:MAG: hypothetical protein M0C28_02430 [Candidatus Moduliflexus flocculans]|nr:hypothetical protein [Candidatus Moduliflexus flocculans]